MLASLFTPGLITILFWIFIGLALGGLLAWWLAVANGSTSRAQSLASLKGMTARVQESRTEAVDQLEAIEGVGPQIAQLLHRHGIHRFDQIAAMTPTDITKLLAAGGSAFAVAQPFTWPFQGRLLANGWIAEFLEVGQRLKAGRLPLDGLPGVGTATAERLSAVDAGSVHALAAADTAVLARKLAGSGEAIAESRLAGFVSEARKLLAGDGAGLAAFFGLPATVLGARAAATYTRTRDVEGKLLNAQSLFGAGSLDEATAGRSLRPFWLGVAGAAIMALLTAMGIGGHKPPKAVATIAPPHGPAAGTAQAIPEGEGLIVDMRNGRPALLVFFAVAKSDVTNRLATESAVLKEYLNAHPEARLSVSGYVDPTGDAAFNAELALSRAQKVAAAIAAAGIPTSRIDLDKPADIIGDSTSYANDRKVEVTVKDGSAAHAAAPDMKG
jgi:flagellar motor protein MotB